ncbi:MAG: thioredoxin domain-containing protein [Chlamydiales bacterium]|nr:thioredoxin domain-containing protein [Chlamydiales bacterium]
MKHFYTRKQLLVIITFCLALIGLAFGWYYSSKRSLSPTHIEVLGCPVFGEANAPVNMVLFEDFLCGHCQVFNQEVLPKIQEKYIHFGRVQFTLIPLAFLPGSKPLANAVLELCDMAPDRLLPYIYELSRWADEGESLSAVQQKLVDLAKRIGGIDLPRFRLCVMSDCQEMRLEKNLELAKQIMGRDFATPALYINGVPSSAHSFEEIQSRVESLISKEAY